MITKLIDNWTERIQGKKNNREKIIEYYEEAGPDYGDWSTGYNMHFGYYRWGMNPFKLEPMLNSINKEVLDRLELCRYKNNNVLDMGCGLGATIRYALGRYPIGKITGITIVPWQIKQAIKLAKQDYLSYKASFELEDYQATRYDDESYDGIYAIESACHATGMDKKKLLTEAYRLLKPGKSLVIADAYFKHKGKMNPIYKYCYKKMCEYWAVEQFGNINDVKIALSEIGYKNIKIEEISWHIAPSVMFIPFVAVKYFMLKVLPTKFTNRQRWNHFMASVYSMIIGLARQRFGYYLITAKK